MVGKISFITFSNGVNLGSMLGTHFLRMNVKLMTVSQKFKSCMNFQVCTIWLNCPFCLAIYVVTLFTNESGQDHVVQYLDKKNNIHDFAFYFLLSYFLIWKKSFKNLAKVALKDIKKLDKLQKPSSRQNSFF